MWEGWREDEGRVEGRQGEGEKRRGVGREGEGEDKGGERSRGGVGGVEGRVIEDAPAARAASAAARSARSCSISAT